MTNGARASSPARWVLDNFEELIAGAALVIIILAVSWGVVTRYITAQAAAWASELATLAFAWLVFFGASACIKYRLHPSIDMLVRRLPVALQFGVRWFNHALLLGFFVFMTWFGTRFAIAAWSNPSPVLRLPLAFLYGPIAFCFALMIVRYLQVLTGRAWTIDPQRETNVG